MQIILLISSAHWYGTDVELWKLRFFFPKKALLLCALAVINNVINNTWLSVDNTNLLSPLARNAKHKTKWDPSGNQAQPSPTRDNPVLSSLL